MLDVSDNAARVGIAATLNIASSSEVEADADAADPFETQVDTSRRSGPRPRHPPLDRTRISSEVLSPTQPSNALPDVRQTFDSHPLSIFPTVRADPVDAASFAEPFDPDIRPARKPSPPPNAAAPPALPPLRPVEHMAAAKQYPASPSSVPAPAIADRSAERLAPSPRSAEVRPIAQATRKTQGEHSDPAPARTDAPSIRVTIGKVDIRASSPPQPPQRSPSLKESKGFAELRLSRGHLGRTYV